MGKPDGKSGDSVKVRVHEKKYMIQFSQAADMVNAFATIMRSLVRTGAANCTNTQRQRKKSTL